MYKEPECQFKRVHKKTCKEEWWITTETTFDRQQAIKGKWTDDPNLADTFLTSALLCFVVSKIKRTKGYYYYIDYLPELLEETSKWTTI